MLLTLCPMFDVALALCLAARHARKTAQRERGIVHTRYKIPQGWHAFR